MKRCTMGLIILLDESEMNEMHVGPQPCRIQAGRQSVQTERGAAF